MSRLTADTTQIKAVAGSSLSQALRSLIMLLGALVMMFVTSPHLSLLVLLAIPADRPAAHRLRPLGAAPVAPRAGHAGGGFRLRRREPRRRRAPCRRSPTRRRLAARYRRAVELAFDAAKERMRARAVLTALAMFLVVASITGVLWFGAAAVIDGR